MLGSCGLPAFYSFTSSESSVIYGFAKGILGSDVKHMVETSLMAVIFVPHATIVSRVMQWVDCGPFLININWNLRWVGVYFNP